MNIPDGLFYTKDHEWIKIEDGLGTIGITDYAQDALGDITFVELPEIGTEIKQFETFASVESVKAVSDVYAPMSGKVIKINQKLSTSPELINKSPYEQGWLVVIEIYDESEREKLMRSKDYQKYLEGLE
ncbi:Glycine cleavage H-protein, subgroup [Candidatus Desulfofervidus auxilii]|uniref:Glycine cleavage system H protein n=1 Tax=Desulfofervidus auxilii TaxID=1621989 RepID=A0A7U4TG34_DESA2|nr:glycine cleavage system protein GcvH [Candidatus Desulfofervidus auxilii]AMM40049.1 Glycine cleavage H-protein, subgroup [Candidatus Desulfofervidus auxilii]